MAKSDAAELVLEGIDKLVDRYYDTAYDKVQEYRKGDKSNGSPLKGDSLNSLKKSSTFRDDPRRSSRRKSSEDDSKRPPPRPGSRQDPRDRNSEGTRPSKRSSRGSTGQSTRRDPSPRNRPPSSGKSSSKPDSSSPDNRSRRPPSGQGDPRDRRSHRSEPYPSSTSNRDGLSHGRTSRAEKVISHDQKPFDGHEKYIPPRFS